MPLRCNEVEKQGETNMRAYIETKMSEAMLRTCPNCKKRFAFVSVNDLERMKSCSRLALGFEVRG